MLTEWKPISRPQEQFLALPNSIREGFFGGAAGPGKSECLMMYPIVRKFYEHPRFKALFMRRTYPELKLEIIPRSRELYSALGGKFNKSDLAWEFPSGALIFFGHCEHEDDVHKYDSMEVNLFLPDELESFTRDQYLYIAFTRVRTSYPELPAIIRAAGMPGGVGHQWVKRRFIDPSPKGDKLIIGKGGNKRIYIHSTLKDNPKVSEEYAKGLEVLGEAEKRAKKYGDWSSYEGQVFEEFREKRSLDNEEPEYALHVVPPFDIPFWWPKIKVIDWGYRAQTWVGDGAISPDKRLIVYRERSWVKTKIAEWAPYVREDVDKEDPKQIKICRSALQNRGDEHTIQQQVAEALGRAVGFVNATQGSRIAGKQLLHEYLRWKQKYIPANMNEKYDHDKATWILRNYGDGGYQDYLKRFIPQEPEMNLPKLQIFNTCPLLIEAIKAASYDKTNKEDVATWEGDDPYDGIRYLVDAADKYFDESVAEFKKVQARQGLADEFAANHDWNKLYRSAQALDRQNFTSIMPVGRYHRSKHYRAN